MVDEAAIKKSREVYKRLVDEKSRIIYEKRVLWSLTGSARPIDELVDSLRDKAGMDQMAADLREVKDKLYIRGAGNEYKTIKRWYPWLEFVCFVDRDPVKQASWTIDGHRVISVEEFYERHADGCVLVNSSAYNAEICEELLEHGIPDERIFNFGQFFHDICDRQYFEPGIVTPEKGEVFVDGGAYDGATTRRFASWCNDEYNKIYAFEPDGHNYRGFKESLEKKNIHDLVFLNAGLWDREDTLFSDAPGTQWSRISESDGTERVDVTSIDHTLGGEKATFIKLDVEGAEYRALSGAENTIRTYHPRLAISIYHKPEDIFTLPELILSFSDDYRLYLRHYQMSRFETILYAV